MTPWQPGQSGNPSGKPKLPEELRAIATLSREEVRKIVSKYSRMTKDELDIACTSTKTAMIELAIAAVFLKAIQYGDSNRLNCLLNHAYPQSEQVELRDEIQRLSDGEVITLLKEKLAQLEAPKEP